MAERKRTNPDYLNGVPELLILQQLTESAMYGYQLVEAIHQRSGEVLEFGEGCIYPLLHKLEARKLLTSKRETVNGRQRVVYRTTAAGRRRLKESSARWKRISDTIAHMLEGDGHEEFAPA